MNNATAEKEIAKLRLACICTCLAAKHPDSVENAYLSFMKGAFRNKTASWSRVERRLAEFDRDCSTQNSWPVDKSTGGWDNRRKS